MFLTCSLLENSTYDVHDHPYAGHDGMEQKFSRDSIGGLALRSQSIPMSGHEKHANAISLSDVKF